MSGWIMLVFIIVAWFGPANARMTKPAWAGWSAWSLVMLGLTLALVVDAKGWP